MENKLRHVTCNIGDKAYQLSGDDLYLDALGGGEFEPHMVTLFRSLLKEDMTVVDVGANIGCTALLFSDLARKVYAFEPSPSTFKLLQKNIRDNGKDNVICENAGLGEVSLNSELTFNPDNRSGAFVSDKTQASKGHVTEKVALIEGDTYFLGKRSIFLGKRSIGYDVLKIDVEGFEGKVIKGLSRSMSLNKPIVVLELNHWCLNAFQRISVPDFFDTLLDRFPILYAVDERTFLDLRDESERYFVMYHHILQMKFLNLIGAFSEKQLSQFHKQYTKLNINS